MAAFLVLIFLALNQAMISNQSPKLIPSTSNLQAQNAPSPVLVPVDNDQRGPHSYFPPTRIFSNRYKQPDVASEADQSIQSPANISDANKIMPLCSNAQDLLRSGYLGDNEVVYTSAFGVGRKD